MIADVALRLAVPADASRIAMLSRDVIEHGYHEQSINKATYGGAVDGIRLQKWLRPEGPPTNEA